MELNEFGQPVGALVPEWRTRPHPQPIIIAGEHCTLKPLSSIHADSLYQAYKLDSDGRRWTWLPLQADMSAETFAAWVKTVSGEQDPMHFVVIDNASGRAVGSLALMRIDCSNGVIEVGYVHFSVLMQRTRLSTEAHYLLMRYVFDELGYRRYEWKCHSLNEPSRRAAQRLGFKYEGRFRQAMVVKGRNRDTDWFSIIDGEWPQLKKAFECWLRDENFDENGNQKKRLEAFRE